MNYTKTPIKEYNGHTTKNGKQTYSKTGQVVSTNRYMWNYLNTIEELAKRAVYGPKKLEARRELKAVFDYDASLMP